LSTLVVDGVGLNVRVDGPADAPPIVLSNSLGTDLSMWEPQMPSLRERFRVVRYDLRGHGGSDVSPGPITVDRLGQDVVDLLDALGIERAHVCGLSVGGLVSIWLAARHPDRLDRAVLGAAAARIGTAELWQSRADAVRAGGMAAVVDIVMTRFFSERFRTERPDVVARVAQGLAATPPEGYAAACLALRDADLRAEVARIAAPSLVVVGREDPATPVAEAEWLHARIPGSELVVLEDAGHLCNLEQPERFTDAVVGFLSEGGGSS
jgi:3-oxoadipate enol-lactonase